MPFARLLLGNRGYRNRKPPLSGRHTEALAGGSSVQSRGRQLFVFLELPTAAMAAAAAPQGKAPPTIQEGDTVIFDENGEKKTFVKMKNAG